MSDVTYAGKTFEPYIGREEIRQHTQRVAQEICRDCTTPNPLLLCVLNGAFLFASDLLRACDLPGIEIAFVRLKSYQGTASTGVVRLVGELNCDIEGREVIIVEDIVDTGHTTTWLRDYLAERNPKSVKVASLLSKPDALQVGTPPEYVGIAIPNRFIIGYGLDIDEQARNLPDIYVLKSS